MIVKMEHHFLHIGMIIKTWNSSKVFIDFRKIKQRVLEIKVKNTIRRDIKVLRKAIEI